MVHIHVGKDEGSDHFKLHKLVICGKVPYFEKMFNENFIEGATNSATLPEDDPDACNTIAFWIYSDKLLPLKHRTNDNGKWCIGELYLLADKFCLPDLMDRISDGLAFDMKKSNWISRLRKNKPGSMDSLYHYSPRKTCGMFRLVVSFLCYLLCGTRGAKDLEHWRTESIDVFLTQHDDVRHEVFKMIRALLPPSQNKGQAGSSIHVTVDHFPAIFHHYHS
ncbi:hypothetical protein BPAE_0049g00260 [Botrytis paeoniae]|uniref:BTB domain-containing protein n=1 Tax=Botrytis paeoniae TaxID=278948 RepID=A0A4Z1FVR2_9HELO|nr:hypothetical protein BPAE_0049g00260 [Botrytis paeoniae]